MDVLIGILLGMVEGLTEFAPISSTGHMILVSHLLHISEDPRIKTFEVVIQLGSILAVLSVFWDRVVSLFSELNKNGQSVQRQFNWIHILVGMIPACIVGYLFSHFIKEKLFHPKAVLVSLVLGGVLLLIAEFFKPDTTASSLDEVSYRQAFMVGIFQIFALWPGFSRSGSTISGGLLSGMNYKTASEYTFILAIPMMVIATGKDLFDNMEILQFSDLGLFVSGLITAYIFGFISIRFFLKMISTVRLVPFAVYRFLLAAIFYLFML